MQIIGTTRRQRNNNYLHLIKANFINKGDLTVPTVSGYAGVLVQVQLVLIFWPHTYLQTLISDH